jgi:hypothetical protein
MPLTPDSGIVRDDEDEDDNIEALDELLLLPMMLPGVDEYEGSDTQKQLKMLSPALFTPTAPTASSSSPSTSVAEEFDFGCRSKDDHCHDFAGADVVFGTVVVEVEFSNKLRMCCVVACGGRPSSFKKWSEM